MCSLAFCSYHKDEELEYYCLQCQVCICRKCGEIRHDNHEKTDIMQAAESRKVPMAKLLEEGKAGLVAVKSKMNELIELRKKSKAKIAAAENTVTETVEELIQLLRDHEKTVKEKLTRIDETQERVYEAQLEQFELFVTKLQNSIEGCKDLSERGMSLEILLKEHFCKELLSQSEQMKFVTPEHVNYVPNRETVTTAFGCLASLGQVVASDTDYSQSVAEGKGLNETELGVETYFTITTRDSEGILSHHDQDQVRVIIRSPTGEEEVQITDCKDGNYTVHYKPKSVGRHDVAVEVNGWPLTGSPWRVDMKPHQYKRIMSCGSPPGQRNIMGPWGIAKNETTGNIAVADYRNRRIMVFDKDWKFLRKIDGGRGLRTCLVVKIGHPTSVAYLRNGDIIFTHEEQQSKKLSVITNRGQFIEQFSEHLIEPYSVSVEANDGHVIVCDKGDCNIKVFSPNGAELLQSFNALNCNNLPEYVFCHQDMFFVSYFNVHCVKVFNKEGVFLYDVGSEGPGEALLSLPAGLAVDGFNNLIVCDTGNGKLKIFTLEGNFLTSIDEKIKVPMFVTVCNNGDLLVVDVVRNCIHVLH